MASTRPSTLQVRNRRFPTDAADVPRHWHGGRRSVTSFFDTLSIFFPAGEAFFVRAVKAHKHLVDDPRLLADVTRFCMQEGQHAREHDRYNAALAQRGYPAADLERRVRRVLAGVERAFPKRLQLAGTCALEHYTATMATWVLRDERTLEGADSVMRSLWEWHAIEEVEHRSVAFDVFRAAGGSYAERVTAMAVATAIFWPLVLEHQWRMMRADGTAWSPKEWRALFAFLFVEPGGMRDVVRAAVRSLRPGFHPSELDDAVADRPAEAA